MTPAGKALPRTAVGRALLSKARADDNRDTLSGGSWPSPRALPTVQDILAIEAEAAAPLRAALERLIEACDLAPVSKWEFEEWWAAGRPGSDALEQAREALAATPPAATEEREDD